MTNIANPGNSTANIVGTTSVSGLIGQGLQFNGASNHIFLDAGSAESAISGTIPWSVSTWINISSFPSGAGTLIAHPESVESEMGLFLLANGQPDMLIQSPTSFGNLGTTGDSPISLDQWHHIVGVRDSASMLSLYVDGILVDSDSGNTPSINSTRRIYIGAHANSLGTLNSFFSGSMDELRIYDSALSASEVSDLYLTTLDAATVPEPSTYALILTGLIGLGVVRRKRKSQLI